MPIIHAGDVNLAAQVVPNILVQIVPPQVQQITGVPTNVAGIVGTAIWGPVGVPVIVDSYQGYVRNFGPLQARARDMGTILATAAQQGANNFRCVRVTDGTDTAAQAAITDGALTPITAITFTSRYSGSMGNRTTVTLSAGSKTGTWRAVVALPGAGFLPEVFDNIEGAGNDLWVAIAAAINNGQFGVRSGSEIVIATAGAATVAPTAGVTTLAGGTDGVAGVTDASLVGLDTAPRTGMYALRGAGVSLVALAECTDTGTWAAQTSFGRTEGAYMMLVGARGDTVSNATAAKAAAGIDDQAAKVLHGDWIYWLDNQNGQPDRLVSPQGFALGRYANLSPEQSGLNKAIYNIVGTQRTRLARPYSDADLQALGQAGIDVITNPVPGGSYFGLRFGRNSSSNPTIRGDNHTRMTNFLATTMDAGMGRFVGKLNSDRTRAQCKLTLDTFLGAMMPTQTGLTDGMIEDFRVVCDESNNPPERRGIGYLQADVQVRYLGIVELLVLNLEGGTTVQITRQGIQAA